MFVTATHPLQIYTPPLREKGSFPLVEEIQKVAALSFKELAFSLGVASLIGFFVAPLFFQTLVTACLVQFAVNSLFRFLESYAAHKASKNGFTHYHFLKDAFSWASPYVFSTFTALNAQTIIHESGHAGLASLLFNKANPKIYMTSFGAAYTEYSVKELSCFGKILGKEKASAWISFAGPALTLTISSFLFALGSTLKESHPRLSRYLLAAAISDFVFHAIYAFSALVTSPKNLAHDFVRLSGLGIHPVAAAVLIAAIPFLIYLGVNTCKKKTTA